MYGHQIQNLPILYELHINNSIPILHFQSDTGHTVLLLKLIRVKHVDCAVVVGEGYQGVLIVLVEIIRVVPVHGVADDFTGIFVVNPEFVHFRPLVFDTVVLWVSFDCLNGPKIINHEKVILAWNVQDLRLLFIFDVDVAVGAGSAEHRASSLLDFHAPLRIVEVIRTYHKFEHLITLESYQVLMGTISILLLRLNNYDVVNHIIIGMFQVLFSIRELQICEAALGVSGLLEVEEGQPRNEGHGVVEDEGLALAVVENHFLYCVLEFYNFKGAVLVLEIAND